MKAKIYGTVVAVLCMGGVLIYMRSVSSNTPENEATKVGEIEPESQLTPQETTADLRQIERKELAQTDSDHYFNLERSMRDKDYAMKARKSVRISQYLNAPRRGDPNYEQVLHTLLKNGFGIEDWRQTTSNISEWHMPYHIRRYNLEERGDPAEAIEENLRNLQAIRENDYELIKEALIHDIGITDMSVLDELMGIPIVMDNGEYPFGRSGYDLYEGDPLLTDEDWMTPEHKASQASYQGEPREPMTDEERIKLYREWKAQQLGIDPETVPPLNRNYVGFGSPPPGWKPGQPLKSTP